MRETVHFGNGEMSIVILYMSAFNKQREARANVCVFV